MLDAARALLEEEGYPGATIEAIAARSGVAKTTIYRRWPNRTALVVHLLVEMSNATAPPPAGKDPLLALRTELRQVAAVADALEGRLVGSLVGEAHHDPEVRTALLQGIFYPRREASAKVIRQAQASGALRRDVPPSVVMDLLFGPLFYRMLVRHAPPTVAFVNQVFDHVMQGLRPGK